ncbi:MAG: PAS domain-containing protein [Rhizobiaceae bacterium]
MRHAQTKILLAYWNRLRGSRAAPERGEIEPSDIREILGDTFILDISPQLRTISFRLAGTRLCAAFGKELKSYGYLGLWDEDDNFEIARAISRVYNDYTPVLISHTARTDSGKFVEFETLLLPLMPIAEGSARVLGVSTPKKVPYWLGAEALTANQCKGLRSLTVPGEAPPLVPEFSENAATGEQMSRKVGHLTVLTGGKS